MMLGSREVLWEWDLTGRWLGVWGVDFCQNFCEVWRVAVLAFITFCYGSEFR